MFPPWRPAAHNQHMDDAGKTAPGRKRVTVTLTPQAAAALAVLCGQGHTATGAVDRALRVYGALQGEIDAGAEVVVRRPGGAVLQVMFL